LTAIEEKTPSQDRFAAETHGRGGRSVVTAGGDSTDQLTVTVTVRLMPLTYTRSPSTLTR
jgi:hypothetical protein